MKKLLFTMLLAITICTPLTWAADAPETPVAKKPVDFTVASTDGYRNSYYSKEEIAFQVAGIAPESLAVEPKNGFHVQAMIVADGQSKPYASGNGAYDEEKHAWQLLFTAPTEASNSYRLIIYLYCAQPTGLCADTYGQAAQVQKELPLQVR